MAKIFAGSLGLVALLTAGLYRDTQPEGASGTGTAAPEVKIPEGMKGQVFHFRKEKIKAGEEGKEIEVFKHPSVTLALPVPTVEQVRDIFNAPSVGDNNRGSEQKFILDLISDAFYVQARDQINSFREENEGKKYTVTSDVLDYSKLTITALANMPASERGSKISDEDMDAFIKDYLAVMPSAANKDAAKIKAQAEILEKGLRTVKTDKKVLGFMDDFLTLWAGSTSNLEEHTEVYDYLKGRIKKWVAKEPANVLESIM